MKRSILNKYLKLLTAEQLAKLDKNKIKLKRIKKNTLAVTRHKLRKKKVILVTLCKRHNNLFCDISFSSFRYNRFKGRLKRQLQKTKFRKSYISILSKEFEKKNRFLSHLLKYTGRQTRFKLRKSHIKFSLKKNIRRNSKKLTKKSRKNKKKVKFVPTYATRKHRFYFWKYFQKYRYFKNKKYEKKKLQYVKKLNDILFGYRLLFEKSMLKKISTFRN